jgi:hypothetical protein
MKRYAGPADYPAPLILQIRAFAFRAWLILLTTQIMLIRTRRPLVHMTFGTVGFALVPLMAVSAFLSEVYSERFRFVHPPNSQEFLHHRDFLCGRVHGIGHGRLAERKQPAAHKRLILLATTVIVGAAYTRWSGKWLYEMFGDRLGGMILNTYTGTNLILLGALSYDWWTRGRLHPVYETAVPAILAGEIATTFIYHSPKWLPVAHLAIQR